MRMKSGESIIGTLSGVIKSKTLRRLPEEQRWCAEYVLSIRGVPSNPVPGVGGDHIPIEVGGSRHAERGEDEHAPAQEREKYDTQPTGAVPDLTVRRMYMTRSHISDLWSSRRMSRMQGNRNTQINATMNAERGQYQEWCKVKMVVKD